MEVGWFFLYLVSCEDFNNFYSVDGSEIKEYIPLDESAGDSNPETLLEGFSLLAEIGCCSISKEIENQVNEEIENQENVDDNEKADYEDDDEERLSQ